MTARNWQMLTAVVAIAAASMCSFASGNPARGDDFTWPETPAGTVLHAFFEAFNAGTLEAMTEFERSWGDEPDEAEQSAARIHAIVGQVGSLTALELQESSDVHCAVIAQPEKLPMKLLCQIQLKGAGESWQVDSISLRPASTSPTPADPAWDRSDWATAQQLVERAVASTGTPAIAVVVMEDGKVVEEAIAGHRSVDAEDEVTIDDRFHIGSITKSMTATAVASVIESGKLQWTDTLGALLPDVEMHDAYRNVTVEELLQHRSGVPAMTSVTDEDIAPLDALQGSTTEIRAQFIQRLLKEAPVVEPHGVSAYSNAGYSLVAHLAEIAAGRSWEQLLREVIFAPLNLETAGFGWPASPTRPDQPRGHQFVNDAYQTIPFGEYELGPYLDPAGDVHCSVHDLARYGQAHLRGLLGENGIVSAKSTRRLHTSMHPELDSMPYAGGWVLRKEGERTVHWHNGSAGTFFAQLELEPDRQRVCVVVMNVGTAGQEITNRLLAAVRARRDAAAAVSP